MTITDKQLEEWESRAKDTEIAFPYGVRAAFTALINEVRRVQGELVEERGRSRPYD